jgi:hypothetical protein
MLSLNDSRWQELKGGYRVLYNAAEPLKRLEDGEDMWHELWENLHHQGDLGEASYAAVPHLVRIAGASGRRDWNVYAFVALVEVERHRKKSPALPAWIEKDYEDSWRNIGALALSDLASTNDDLVVRSALSVVALAKKQQKLDSLLSYLDESEIDESAEEYLAWSQLYG